MVRSALRTKPLLPSMMIHEYAPMKGGESSARTASVERSGLPAIRYRAVKNASGTPSATDPIVPPMETTRLFRTATR
jgi:hypothetical protein